MIEKLRARHGIDLPVENWERTWGLAIVLGGLSLLFVVLPVLGALAYGLLTSPVGAGRALAAVVLGFVALGVALLVVGAATTDDLS